MMQAGQSCALEALVHTRNHRKGKQPGGDYVWTSAGITHLRAHSPHLSHVLNWQHFPAKGLIDRSGHPSNITSPNLGFLVHEILTWTGN